MREFKNIVHLHICRLNNKHSTLSRVYLSKSRKCGVAEHQTSIAHHIHRHEKNTALIGVSKRSNPTEASLRPKSRSYLSYSRLLPHPKSKIPKAPSMSALETSSSKSPTSSAQVHPYIKTKDNSSTLTPIRSHAATPMP